MVSDYDARLALSRTVCASLQRTRDCTSVLRTSQRSAIYRVILAVLFGPSVRGSLNTSRPVGAADGREALFLRLNRHCSYLFTMWMLRTGVSLTLLED